MCASNQIVVDSMHKKIQDIFMEYRGTLLSEKDPELRQAISNMLDSRYDYIIF